MGFRFRKSIKIIPGIRVNFGKKGYTSTTVGGKFFKTNFGKKGIKHTATLPGTGLSYQTETKPYSQKEPTIDAKNTLYWYCQKCHLANYPNAQLCRNCGGAYTPNLQTIRQQEAAKRAKVKVILICSFLLFVISSVVVLDLIKSSQPIQQSVAIASNPSYKDPSARVGYAINLEERLSDQNQKMSIKALGENNEILNISSAKINAGFVEKVKQNNFSIIPTAKEKGFVKIVLSNNKQNWEIKLN